MSHRIQLKCLAALTTILMASVVAAQSAQPSQPQQPAKLQSIKQALVLNGRGIRSDAAGPLYSASLYLSTPARSAEAALTQNGTRLMKVRMLRAINGAQVGELLAEGLKQNNSEDTLFPLISEVFELGKLIGASKQLKVGDGFDIEWNASGETRITVMQGRERAAARQRFFKPELAAPMMRVWLGEKPVDPRLKQALLGTSA